MTTENELIKKSYYRRLIDVSNNEHPIKILGEMYQEEMQKEQPDVSFIRFAQGEVYFLNNDFEAAIFKWQHPLDDELFPWAQKNIADAHMELGLLDYAENFYKEVETDSVTLKSEVLLSLFSLYIQQNDLEKSVATIKNAVELNPDYEGVTEIARRYFEEIQDWGNAVELAVNEVIRTESAVWIDVLQGYANEGHTSNYEPHYFTEVLLELFHLDKQSFERLVEGLWNSYRDSAFYFEWLEEINQLLLNVDWEPTYTWEKLPNLFQDAYFHLVSGKFFIRDISNLIRDHLSNWLELSSVSNGLVPATAILSWNESFPSDLNAALVLKAEHHYENSDRNKDNVRDGLELLNSIQAWAEKEGLLEGLNESMSPLPREYNLAEASPSRIHDLIKDALDYLLNQKLEMEDVILQDINWNGEMLKELHDYQRQISDQEEAKAEKIKNSFREAKNKLMESIEVQLPKLLQDCSSLVKEDSDYSKLLTLINEEMNNRIARYMKQNALPEFKQAFDGWIENCEMEFQESQVLCTEFTERINEQFNEEKVVLAGDFKVLEDWQRDIERISRMLLRPEKINILLRNNPSQLFLKGAGKLLGPLAKNKDMLVNRYKDYIENADYKEVTQETIKVLRQQLELFEESLEWDVERFFKEPEEKLNNLIEEVQVNMEEQSNALNQIQENPELYRDPLTLFELRLRQYELVNMINANR
ncbi:hypothetical protein M3210_17945 [Oceanobacillus luteolus]|uniref:Tetratricopeptide repeat protein n=1 Tax=Oceanobacillus luteolus TaxID=1274358 RepID=A0ABW4HTJ4_9BACI|nr:hypothetical protein [Oceanobacillus luteolus]MCM3742121.1 hypothetical protein [Oceanobacillus luteolus]